MKWYKIDGEFKPEGEVLAKNKYGDVIVGYLNIDINNECCESGSEMICNVTHFIPISELIINIEEEK